MNPLTAARRDTRGSISVELALLLTFVLMPLLVGVIDFGQLLHAQNVMTRAAREGAIAASRNMDIEDAVNRYVQNAGYDASLTRIDTEGSRESSEPVTVTITYDTSAMVILPWADINRNMSHVVTSATTQQLY
ncbi:TadE/TadG family type IV pilus assembly protein [Desulfolutivibrio sp.]|uniref:TadE/TadG family type IV pilus assembly protein n=1 Tax=Desulfolutivibrio sp. TaxID=2773296 RepID=UPI002F961AA1